MQKSSYWYIRTTKQKKRTGQENLALLYLTLLSSSAITPFSLKLNLTLTWTLLSREGLSSLGWSALNRFDRLTFHETTRKMAVSEFSNISPISSKLNYKSTNYLWNQFVQSWNTFRPKSTIIYQTNRDFRLFFLTSSPTYDKLPLVSIKRYFARWVDSYNFLFNLFATHPFAQMISNKLFMEESLVFNWNYSYGDYKLFKYLQPFFIFADIPHGSTVPSSLALMFLNKIDFTIVTDINNHNKLTIYLQKNNIFTVGLIPNNYSPWRVSYAIPSFSDSPLTQMYFIRWILSLQSQTNTINYMTKRRLWSAPKF